LCWERLKGFTRSRTYKVLTDVTHFLLGVVFTVSVLLGDTVFRCLGLYGIVYFTLYELLTSKDLDECVEDVSEFMLGVVITPILLFMVRALGLG